MHCQLPLNNESDWGDGYLLQYSHFAHQLLFLNGNIFDLIHSYIWRKKFKIWGLCPFSVFFCLCCWKTKAKVLGIMIFDIFNCLWFDFILGMLNCLNKIILIF